MKKSQTIAAVPEKQPSLKKYYYILGIVAFFLFANTMGNGYTMDDELVTRNHKLTSRGLEAVGEIFTSSYYSDDMGYAYGYRPMVHLSYALEHQFFGEKPEVSHFFNVLLYAFSIVLFFKLLLKWTGEKGLVLAVVAAALFAIHPVHTEVVASIKNRDEILAFLFVILAGLSFGKYLDKKRIVSLVCVALFFTCAMLSKKSVYPMMLVLPLAFYFFRHQSYKDFILPVLCLLVPSVWLASENDLYRAFLLTIMPVAVFTAVYFLHRFLYAEDKASLREILLSYQLHLVFSMIFFLLSLWKNEMLYFCIAQVFTLILLFQNKQVGIVSLGLQAMLFGYFGRQLDMIPLAMIITSICLFDEFFGNRTESPENKKIIRSIYVTLMVLLSIFFVFYNAQLEPFRLAVIAAILLFAWLLYRQTLLALALAVAINGYILVFLGWEHLTFLSVLVLAIPVYKLIFEKQKRLVNYSLLIALTWICFLVQPKVSTQVDIPYTASSQQVAEAELQLPAKDGKEKNNQNILREGRSLEPIENTLVVPHTPSETLGTGLATLGEYMRLMVFPAELSFYYGYAKTKTVSLNNPWVWVSILVHLSLILLALWQLKKRPLLSIGIAWYLLSILLFSNWVELVAGMVGERLAFTASAGFCIFIATLVLWIKPDFSFRKPGILELFVLVVLVTGAARTVVRNTNWKDNLTLMGNDISHLHNSAQANNLYGLHLIQSAKEDQDLTQVEKSERQRAGISYLSRALEIWPEFYNAAVDKGWAGLESGDPQVATEGFEKALSISATNLADPYYKLCDLYIAAGRKKDLLATAKALHQNFAKDPLSYNYLAKAYLFNGDKDSSLIFIDKGFALFPGDLALTYRLCDLYIEQQRYAEYLVKSQEIFSRDSENPDAYNYHARGFAVNGQMDRAVEILRQGVAKFPENVDLQRNLKMVGG